MKTKAMCSGCYNDFYNHGGGGADGCWSFASAEVCKRAFVHLSTVPPCKVRLETTLTCHRRPKHVAISPGMRLVSCLRDMMLRARSSATAASSTEPRRTRSMSQLPDLLAESRCTGCGAQGTVDGDQCGWCFLGPRQDGDDMQRRAK